VTLRQAVAFTSTALILHLGFIARESHCAPEHADSGTHHHHNPQPQHPSHSEHQTAPTIPPCCQALTSCSLTVDVT